VARPLSGRREPNHSGCFASDERATQEEPVGGVLALGHMGEAVSLIRPRVLIPVPAGEELGQFLCSSMRRAVFPVEVVRVRPELLPAQFGGILSQVTSKDLDGIASNGYPRRLRSRSAGVRGKWRCRPNRACPAPLWAVPAEATALDVYQLDSGFAPTSMAECVLLLHRFTASACR